MAPRKRLRPNPAEGSSGSLPTTLSPQRSSRSHGSVTSEATSVAEDGTMASTIPVPGNDAPSPLPNIARQVRKTRSFYGSWPRAPKASPSTLVARENIFGGTLMPASSPDLSRFDKRRNGEPSSLNGPNESTASLPNIQENGHKDTEDATERKVVVDEAPKGTNDTEMKGTENIPPAAASGETPQRPSTSSGWLGWFGRTSAPALPEATAPVPEEVAAEPIKEPEPSKLAPELTVLEPTPTTGTESAPEPPVATASWFDFWSSTHKQPVPIPDSQGAKDTGKKAELAKEQADIVMEDAPPVATTPVVSPPPPSVGSTWAFWSRDTKLKSPSGKSTPQPETGELAVIGEVSEADPKPANSSDVKEPLAKDAAKDGKGKTTPATRTPGKRNKRLRPQSMEMDVPSPSPSAASTPKPESSSKSSKQDATPRTDSVQKQESSRKGSPAKDTPAKPNLLLPSFNSTYRMKENPSILKQIAQLLLRTQQPATNHVFRVTEFPKVKKAIAIGVHGLFPAMYLRPMIGQPTGTSLRFASLCADAIRRWADSHGCGECEIEKVALEGEGRIADRVDNLWKLLLNWIEQIRSADLIILACHSQGVPVAIMLLDKLIDLGIITDAKIGVCAMAGVSLGPFPDYKSSMGMLMGSAAELWEFSNAESDVSQRYEAALRQVLEHGVRITYIGSIDDQLVPMESAIYSPANHPHIYRAVFIDGRIHAPDFIAHLVGFALKLRNLGVSDHGLIRELSVPLAGSLYGGEGHSRIYYDDQVYDLAVAHALETTNAGKVPCHIQKHRTLSNPNPYHLPWIMRGLLEEDFVKTELSAETDELLKQFDDWKPVTKALRDVKYRLEAVRSRL